MQNTYILRHQGFTLIELMIVIAIIGVLLTVVVPSFNDFFDKNRLKQATEEVYGLIMKAKAETVTRNTDLVVTVDTGEWCVGYAATACDCSASNCTVAVAGTQVKQVVNGAEFSGVSITGAFSGGSSSTFDRVRGSASAGGIQLRAGDWGANVVVSAQGRVIICAPDLDGTATENKNINRMGYSECP